MPAPVDSNVKCRRILRSHASGRAVLAALNSTLRGGWAIIFLDGPHEICDLPLAVCLDQVDRVDAAVRDLTVRPEFVLAPDQRNWAANQIGRLPGPSFEIVVAV